MLSVQNIIIMQQTNLRYHAQVDELLLRDVISGAFTIGHTWHVPGGSLISTFRGPQASFETPRK